MNKRVILSGLVVLATLAGLPAISPSAAQSNPTANPATIEALVQQRFDATSAFAAFGDLKVTVDAAFALAQTATAAAPTPAATATASIPTPTPIAPTNPSVALDSDWVSIPAIENFQMGTTFAEIAQAVNQCTIDEQGNCSVDMAQDSLPAHTVKLAAFQIQRSEVTADQYAAFLNASGPGSHVNGCEVSPCVLTRTEDENSLITFDGNAYTSLGGALPIYKVTWYGAKAYCEAAGGRLPTEAEWEYAARGSDGRVYPWGNTWDPLNARTSIPVTTEVGPLPINSHPSGISPFGLYDMAGNVAEWISDWYDPAFYNTPAAIAPNPTGPVIGTEKVIRGGSWDAKPFFARSIHRQSLAPASTGSWIGFRCAADASAVLSTSSPPIVPTQVLTEQAAQVTSPTALAPTVQPTLSATASG